jgi:hypothetical protein
MKEETIFEKLGIEYQEVDGIFYPILSVPSEESQCLNVGKYGRMWIEHIKITYPQRYRSLVRFGELQERAEMVNETAYELLEDIEVRWLNRHRPKNPNFFIEQLHLRNQARMMAEEVVLHDVVRQFH